DFSHIGSGKDDALAFRGELLYFSDHCRNRAMKARGRARVECKGFIAIGTEVSVSDSQAFGVNARRALESLVPLFGREINFFRTHKRADPAALVAIVDFVPPFFVLRRDRRWLIDDDHTLGQEIEQVLPASRHRSIELPSWEYCGSGCQHGVFDFDFTST